MLNTELVTLLSFNFSSSISGKELLDFLNRLLLSRVRFLKPCDDLGFGRL
jgi:hypothetical protein